MFAGRVFLAAQGFNRLQPSGKTRGLLCQRPPARSNNRHPLYDAAGSPLALLVMKLPCRGYEAVGWTTGRASFIAMKFPLKDRHRKRAHLIQLGVETGVLAITPPENLWRSHSSGGLTPPK